MLSVISITYILWFIDMVAKNKMPNHVIKSKYVILDSDKKISYLTYLNNTLFMAFTAFIYLIYYNKPKWFKMVQRDVLQ